MEPEAADQPPRRRPRTRPRVPRDRGPLIALGGAIAIAAALILYETRELTLFNDEVTIYQALAQGFDAESVFKPRNGHLLGAAALIYESVFSAFGPDYLVLRLVGIAGIAALAVVLYAYLRRRLDPWLALAPVFVILFFGASWETLLWPFSVVTFVFALTAGIAALLCIERRDRRGDVAACALLVFGAFCHSIALPFVVGVAVMLLWRRRNRRRAWVFAVPLALYAVWWLWALKFDEPTALAWENVWVIPAYAAEALAVVLGSLTGLGATISGEGLNPTVQIEPGWGRLLALAALVAFVIRLARRPIPIALVATLVILGLYWTLAALSLGPERQPDESRYVLPGAVLVLLVAANAVSGIRIAPAARIAVWVVAFAAVAIGIRQVHDGSLFLRDYSERAKATATGLAAASASVPPGYEPRNDPALEDVVPSQLSLTAGGYRRAAKEFGPIAYTLPELVFADQEVQDLADRVRVAAIAEGAGVEPPTP